jgi:hypothetical protein
MFKKISLILLFSGGLFSIQAQQTIPFRITKHNNIIVKTLVNKKDSLDLMFQIAMEDASISPERKRKADHISFDKDDISENNMVEIGKINLKNVRFFNNELTGHEADGKIGTGMFSGKAFKIDYDNNQFEIYDQEPNIEGYQRVILFNQNGQFFINADNVLDGKQQQEVYFLLQSGYSGALIYSNNFAEEKGLDQLLKITSEKTMKNSSGESIVTKQGILPFFKLNKSVLKDVPAGFFVGKRKTQAVNYLGADMLRRFNWIFDADRKTAYIKPSKYFSEPYYKIN